jgi:uncharacterized paraquat-inducible protein A
MTSETRTLIEAMDITGIELECPECHITTSYPLRMESIKKIKANCSHCNHQFFDMATTVVAGPDAFPALAALHGIIGNLSRFTHPDQTGVHANIRFRLRTEPRSE